MKRHTLLSLLALVAMMTLLLAVPAGASAQTYVHHRVQPGETLAKLSRMYCTTWQEIYRLNRDSIGYSPNNVYAGMMLTIPNYCAAPSVPPPSGVYDRGPSTHAAGTFRSPYYTTVWGDTLYSIGQRFGVGVSAIQRANGMQSTYVPGGIALLIPGAGGAEVIPPRPPSAPNPAAERVYFGQGGIAATRVGIINRALPKRYILGGRAGQVMEIGTISHGEPLWVSVTTLGGQQLALNGENNKLRNNLWLSLPSTSDYIVSVSPIRTPENPQLAFDITFVIQ